MAVFSKDIGINFFTRFHSILLLVIFLTGLAACGDRDIHTSIIISGSVNGNAIDTYSDKAIMVAVTKASFKVLESIKHGGTQIDV